MYLCAKFGWLTPDSVGVGGQTETMYFTIRYMFVIAMKYFLKYKWLFLFPLAWVDFHTFLLLPSVEIPTCPSLKKHWGKSKCISNEPRWVHSSAVFVDWMQLNKHTVGRVRGDVVDGDQYIVTWVKQGRGGWQVLGLRSESLSSSSGLMLVYLAAPLPFSPPLASLCCSDLSVACFRPAEVKKEKSA